MRWEIDPKVKITYHAPDLNAGDLKQLVHVLNNPRHETRHLWSLELCPVVFSAAVIITDAQLAADYGSDINYTVLNVVGSARVTLTVEEQRRLIGRVCRSLDHANLNPAMTMWPLYTAAMVAPQPWWDDKNHLTGEECLTHMAAIEASPELTRLYCEADYVPFPIETVTPFTASTRMLW